MFSGYLDRNLPQISLNQVKAIVAELYLIDGDYKKLNCERDISYRICTRSDATYIVKISNAAEPEGVVDLQIRALKHIAEQDGDLQVPQMVHTKNDKPFEWIQSDNGAVWNCVRILGICPMGLLANCAI